MVADGEKVFTLDTLLVDTSYLISALGTVSKLGTVGIRMTEYG